MGVVYKAKDPEIGRLVAIKTLKSVYMGDDTAGNEALQRFRQESRSAGKLHHPNIVTIFEAGRASNGSPFIVMEFVEGISLEVMISESGTLDPLAVLHYLSQIANALDYAHAQDVIHRDIKPSNIIVDTKHKPFLLDFGVAKLSDTSLTPAGTVVGTPSYMSPEQIRGVNLDGRSDVFSLAVVAFEAFTGKRPFPGNDFTTVVTNIINKEPLHFKEVESDLPAALEKILHQGMSKEKTERHQSALELMDEAAQALGVVIDGNGLVGGYYPGMLIEDHQKSSSLSQRVKAKTVIGSFNAESLGLKAALQSNKQQEVNGSQFDQEAVATSSFKLGEPATRKEDSSISKSKILTPDENLSSKKNPTVGIFVGLIVLVLIGLGVATSKKNIFKDIFGHIEDSKNVEVPNEVSEEATNEGKNNEELVPTEIVEKQNVVLPEGPFDAKKIVGLSNEQLALMVSENINDQEVAKLVIPEIIKRGNLELLAVVLRSSDYKIKIDVLKAISGLEKSKRESLTADVVSCLNDNNEFLVRGFAAKILTQFKNQEAISALEARQLVEKNQIVLKVLNDSVSQIKNNAAKE